EVQAAALLSHPNIVTGFATDLTGPWPYLAMEYVPGIDLFRLVKQGGALSIADACSYILPAAHGLQHAFEQALVHRDIKPASLMPKLARLFTEPAPSAAARRSDVPSDLDAIIRKLMARDPADRYQTPAELIEALEAFQRNPRGTSRRASHPTPSPTPLPAGAA